MSINMFKLINLLGKESVFVAHQFVCISSEVILLLEDKEKNLALKNFSLLTRDVVLRVARPIIKALQKIFRSY